MQKKRVPLFWSKVCKSTVGRAYIRQLTYSPWVPLNFFRQSFVALPTNCSGRRGCFFLELGRWRFPHHLSTIPILQFDERPMPASPWDINKICLDNLAQSNAITIDIEGNQSREKYQFNRHLYLSRTQFHFFCFQPYVISLIKCSSSDTIIRFFAVTILENILLSFSELC